MRLRVASWNLDSAMTGKLDAKLALLRELEPDLALLQELSRPVYKALLPHPLVHERIHARSRMFGWGALSTDLTRPPGSEYRLGCAVLGVPSTMLLGAEVLDRVPFDVAQPELPGLLRRTLVARVALPGGVTVTACSFRARPGPSTAAVPVNAAFNTGVARWLAGCGGPIVFGIDAGAPAVDHPDLRRSEFRNGRAADELLGPDAAHGLNDVLRRHFDRHPEQLDRIRAERPAGPLAVSHRHAGRPVRYDHVWASPELDVREVRYLYDEAVATGSDHALVLVELEV